MNKYTKLTLGTVIALSTVFYSKTLTYEVVPAPHTMQHMQESWLGLTVNQNIEERVKIDSSVPELKQYISESIQEKQKERRMPLILVPGLIEYR